MHLLDRAWTVGLAAVAVGGLLYLAHFVLSAVSYAEIGRVFVLGLITALRVLVLIVLASLVWVPIGVWIGMRPRLSQRVQPLVLFLSAFPANLLFPLAVIFISTYHLSAEIWLSPLMILGTQWYILFNVIAGAASIPNDLREAAQNLGMRRTQLWKRLILPGIFPALRHRRADGVWGSLERQCGGRGGQLGQHHAHRHRHRFLYCSADAKR